MHSYLLVESDTPLVCGTLFFMELVINSVAYGKHTILYDDEDHELISKIKWNICKSKRTFYARGKVKNKYLELIGCRMIRMHRLIMKCAADLQVDHIDGNGLNNRRNNLRVATQLQNSSNKKLSIDSTTGFKGVSFRKKKGLYITRIRVNGELIHGGLTKNIYSAALKYNELAIKYFGEFACLNELTPEQIELSKIKIRPKKIIKSNITGYRGVCISKNATENIYVATIMVEKKNKYLGSYNTPEKAAKAYNEGVVKYNKPLEWLNIVPNE